MKRLLIAALFLIAAPVAAIDLLENECRQECSDSSASICALANHWNCNGTVSQESAGVYKCTVTSCTAAPPQCGGVATTFACVSSAPGGPGDDDDLAPSCDEGPLYFWCMWDFFIGL